MDKFNKRWNINSTDSYSESFLKFKTRVLNVFKDIDKYVQRESISYFCQFYGIKEVWHSNPYSINGGNWSTNLINRLIQETNEVEFYKLIELILSLEFESKRNIFIYNIIQAIDMSSVNVSIGISENDITLYPKGEKILDNELVNSPLSFLNKESSKHFIEALKFYELKKNIKSAESLRRSLEEFLRFKLKNEKGLSSNIELLNKSLKLSKKDIQVRNIISNIFGFLDKYFNNNSKHNDGIIDENDNEFLIYQIGLLLRYISKIKI